MSWSRCFSVLPDPRRRQGLRFELEAVLGLALAAVIGGARSYCQIAEWVTDFDVHVRRRVRSTQFDAVGLGWPGRTTPPTRASLMSQRAALRTPRATTSVMASGIRDEEEGRNRAHLHVRHSCRIIGPPDRRQLSLSLERWPPSRWRAPLRAAPEPALAPPGTSPGIRATERVLQHVHRAPRTETHLSPAGPPEPRHQTRGRHGTHL